MSQHKQSDFCTNLARGADGRIYFDLSSDAMKWPWLRLHPANNIAVQATNYYAMTAVSRFAGSLGEEWSALTEFAWRAFNVGKSARHPVRGVAEAGEGEAPGYVCDLFDADGARVYHVTGKGVVFRTRDFKAWREKSKAEALALPAPENFTYALPSTVGVSSTVESIVSPLRREGEEVFADALVTAANGFPPAHPYHDGSGDHVNSTHMADAAQQVAQMLRAEQGLGGWPAGGDIAFRRYVELERPFRLTLESSPADSARLAFRLEQGGRPCASIALDYGD